MREAKDIKKILIIALIGILVISSQAVIAVNNCTIQKENSNRSLDWAIMCYLNGDNALSSAQGVILEEIRQVGSTSQVQ